MEQIFSVHIDLFLWNVRDFFFAFPSTCPHTYLISVGQRMMSNLSSYGRGVLRQAFSSSEKLVRLGKVRPASLVGYRPSDPACLACVHPTFSDSGYVPCIYVTLVIILQNLA